MISEDSPAVFEVHRSIIGMRTHIVGLRRFRQVCSDRRDAR